MKVLITKRDRRGVSPVIGVILMVAITVILAAVIASFVFGMGSKVKSAPQAQFMLQDNSSPVSNGPLFDAMSYGGDVLTCGDLRITLKDLTHPNTWVLTWNDTAKRFEYGNTIYTSTIQNVIKPGDTITFLQSTTTPQVHSGDTLEITILHIPTGTIIYDGKVVVY